METPTRPRADAGSVNLLKGSIHNSMRKNREDSYQGNKENRPMDYKLDHKTQTSRYSIERKKSINSLSPTVMATFDCNGQRIGSRPSSPTRQQQQPQQQQLRTSRSSTSLSGSVADHSFSMPSPQIAHLSPKFKLQDDSWTTPQQITANRSKRPPTTPLTPGQFQSNVRRVKLGTPATVSTCNLFYPPSRGLAEDDDDEEEDTDPDAHTAPFPSLPAFKIDTPVTAKPLPSFNPNWDSPDCHLSDSTPMGTPDTVVKMRRYISRLKSKPRFENTHEGDVSQDNVSFDEPASPVKSRKQPLVDLSELESKLVSQRYDLEIEQMTDVLEFMKLEARLKV